MGRKGVLYHQRFRIIETGMKKSVRVNIKGSVGCGKTGKFPHASIVRSA
jgi:hypothetical protein